MTNSIAGLARLECAKFESTRQGSFAALPRHFALHQLIVSIVRHWVIAAIEWPM